MIRVIFFFQAEDGIRDGHVTGVQTCALPISTAKAAESTEQAQRARLQSRVFSVMQYREHPETGEVMLTQEQIDEGLAAMGDRYALHRWAYVWHPYVRLVEVDEGC